MWSTHAPITLGLPGAGLSKAKEISAHRSAPQVYVTGPVDYTGKALLVSRKWSGGSCWWSRWNMCLGIVGPQAGCQADVSHRMRCIPDHPPNRSNAPLDHHCHQDHRQTHFSNRNHIVATMWQGRWILSLYVLVIDFWGIDWSTSNFSDKKAKHWNLLPISSRLSNHPSYCRCSPFSLKLVTSHWRKVESGQMCFNPIMLCSGTCRLGGRGPRYSSHENYFLFSGRSTLWRFLLVLHHVITALHFNMTNFSDYHYHHLVGRKRDGGASVRIPPQIPLLKSRLGCLPPLPLPPSSSNQKI